MLADKYKKSRSKFELENLGNYEKIYPSANHRPLYIAIMEASAWGETANQSESANDTESYVDLSPSFIKEIKKE